MRYFLAIVSGLALCAQPDVIRSSTSEVIVDVVVRDKKGKLVRGLSAGDFTVLENGLSQRVTSVREFSGALTADAPNSVAATLPDPTRRIRLITLVFDKLGVDSRRLARQAAKDLIKDPLAENVYIAVFTSDLFLRAVQPFTNDREKLRLAIDKAAGASAMTNYADVNGAIKLAIDASNGSEGAAAAAGAGAQGAGVDGGAMAQEAINRMVTDMLEFAETSAQEQQGRSSIFGLWGIVKEQTRLPGRKTVLYFSEGLPIPNSLLGQFRSMIATANRANVSVYPIDARGLAIDGDSGASQQLMATSLKTSQKQYRSTEDSGAVTRQEATQFDRALDAIHSNGQLNLAELAEATGGFLIANMNDFRQPLRRLNEDVGSYYELTYRPLNEDLDGGFRAIETKVNRPDVKIQSRSGYFALPTVNGKTVAPHEVPLLRALSQSPLPRGIDFRAGVLLGRPAAGHFNAMIVFEMPMKDMTFRAMDPEPSYRVHTTFLALVKDSQGQVVGRISRDLPVDQPKANLLGFQSGRVIFSHPLTLAPGRYAIEAAAADVEGKKIAARRTALIVPNLNESALAVSSPVLVRRLDAASAKPQANDLFLVGAKRIVPTLQDVVPGGAKSALSFFFTLYPAAGEAKPYVEIDFVADDQRIGGGAVELPAPQADGSIPYIATVPLGGFKAGLYEVRIRARQGPQAALRSFFVTIE